MNKEVEKMERKLRAAGWVTDGERSYRDRNGEDICFWTHRAHQNLYVVINCHFEWEFSTLEEDWTAGAYPSSLSIEEAVAKAYAHLEAEEERRAEEYEAAIYDECHGGEGTAEQWASTYR